MAIDEEEVEDKGAWQMYFDRVVNNIKNKGLR